MHERSVHFSTSLAVQPPKFNDNVDYSLNPSFTNFQIPYEIQCKIRYLEKIDKYENQFQHELKLLEVNQTSAYEAARFNRHLCITTLWPHLHTRKDIRYFLEHFFKHSEKNQKRLHLLLRDKQIYIVDKPLVMMTL